MDKILRGLKSYRHALSYRIVNTCTHSITAYTLLRYCLNTCIYSITAFTRISKSNSTLYFYFFPGTPCAYGTICFPSLPVSDHGLDQSSMVINHLAVCDTSKYTGTKFCWVGKRINNIMKPMNSPTQGRPNPRKNRLKVANWATFSHSKYFFVGWDLFHIGKQTTRSLTQPSSPRKHPDGM